MAYTLTLQRRIVIAFFLLTLALCGGFAAVTYFVIHELETELFYEHLQQDAEWLISAGKDGTPLKLPPGIQLYRSQNGNMADLPEYLKSVEEDKVEVILENKAYHVIVRHEGETSYFLVQDQSRFEETEMAVATGLFMAFIGALAAALWLGSATANRVIEPVIRLANQVRGMGRDGSGKYLSPREFSEDEVGQLASAFEQYSQRLHDFLNRERLFTGDVSHELRTPLMVVTSACELLITDSNLDTKQQQKMQRIYRAAQEMHLLVDTFLMMSREDGVDTGHIESFLVNSIVKEEIDGQRLECNTDSVDIQVIENAEPELCGIPQMFRVVVRNLLHNAFHYTREGTVSVTINQDTVEVRDTGLGIPEGLRESVFERHVQGLNASDLAQGQGLGLSIVRRICAYHAWSIRFAPVLPTGSHFVLDFSQHPESSVRT